jgi:hypothetical protein
MTTPMTPDDGVPRGRSPRAAMPREGPPPQGYPEQGYPGQGYPEQRSPVQGRRGPGAQVDAGRLWAGGVATAVVAGLVALVGIMVCRWLFKIPLLAPQHDGAYGDVHTTAMVLVAAAAALLATGLAYLLLLSTPRPLTFFGWIIGLATVLVVILPFSTSAPVSNKAATAAVDLIIGIAIGTLLNGAAARSVRLPRSGAGYPADPAAVDNQL